MIPKVRTWRVRSVETGKVYFIDTINRRFAFWMAREQYGLWMETLKISLVKEKDDDWKLTDHPNMVNY